MKNKLSITLVICVLSLGNSKAQDSIQHVSLIKGVYLSYDEFLNNSPSGPNSFSIVEESETGISRNLKYTAGRNVQSSSYRIIKYKLKDEGGRKFKEMRNFWGYSDGRAIYFNLNNIKGGNYFVKLQVIGSICYFFQLGENSKLLSPGTYATRYNDPRNLGNPTIYYLNQYILEKKTGEINLLTKNRLLKIVEPYPSLVDEVKALDKDDIFLHVVQAYVMQADFGIKTNLFRFNIR